MSGELAFKVNGKNMSGCDFTLGGTNRCKGTTVWEMVSNQARNLCLSQLEVEFSQHRWCIFCRVPLISVFFILHLLSTRTVKLCVTEHTLLFPLSLSMCTHKCNTMRNASFLSVQSIYKHICHQMWSVDLFDSSLPSDLEELRYYIPVFTTSDTVNWSAK